MRAIVTSLALLAAFGAARAEPATYALDPEHSWVIYEIGHMGTSTNRGRFQAKQGTVVLDRGAKTGKADITINTAAPLTGVASLDHDLAARADFFDAAQFPTGRFVAESFVFDGDKVSGLDGSLTLRGKSHPVTLKALRFNCYQNPMFKREVCGGDFETNIKRSLWGVSWGLNFGFPDDVHLLVQVEGIKQQ